MMIRMTDRNIYICDGHRGLEDMQIKLIDHVKGEKELRERENHWIYKLATLAPHGLNDNDGFYAQNKKSRAIPVTVFSHPEEEY